MQRLEQQIHKAVIAHLKQRGAPGLVWFHPPNGGSRRPKEAAILKGLGVRPGVSDLILLHKGHAYALELKAPGGRVSKAQDEFIMDWNGAGGLAFVADDIDRALRILEGWGLLIGAIQ